jgi:hypothetical protein
MLMASLAIAGTGLAADVAAIAPFSSAAPGGALPAGWREVALPRVKPAEVSLVADEGTTVLRVFSDAAAGSAVHSLRGEGPVHPTLSWRWKVDRVVENADLAQRRGDDFAARVYVFFDVPVQELSFSERWRLRVARLIHGDEVPTAGICYVWDNRHAPGTVAPNPYAPRIRTFVLQSAATRAGRWLAERRDLDADFQTAFGPRRGAVPRVTGIAAGNDTDQTGERVTAWFGDFALGARPTRGSLGARPTRSSLGARPTRGSLGARP